MMMLDIDDNDLALLKTFIEEKLKAGVDGITARRLIGLQDRLESKVLTNIKSEEMYGPPL